ncbi:glycosyltransferase family 2 protein [Candidatus Parcubacteria bacterium]|nr:MAG: glycosyltransferase family 2 protein [Candidatus Parcubacteria bacterium]
MPARVCIVYLCHNDRRWAPEVVESWASLRYPKQNLTIAVVPNGAQDGIQQYFYDSVLPRVGKDLPEIKIFDDGVNRGFAGGNNLAIKWAVDNDFDYVFLNNGDLKVSTDTITQLVEVMENDKKIAAAQPVIKLWQDKKIINSTGNMIHVAGYGYARDNGILAESVDRPDKDEVAYCSGAAVMYRIDILREVGLLEDGFFMYHEDLELGLRFLIAGYKNVLAANAEAYHYYQFARNKKMFYWIEIYRLDVLIAYLRFRSLILLTPFLIIADFGSLISSVKEGWFLMKLKTLFAIFSLPNLALILKMRQRAAELRKVRDRYLLSYFTPIIEFQNKTSLAVQIVNRIFAFLWSRIYKIISW